MSQESELMQRAPRKVKGIPLETIRKMNSLRWLHGLSDRALSQRFGYSATYIRRTLKNFEAGN